MHRLALTIADIPSYRIFENMNNNRSNERTNFKARKMEAEIQRKKEREREKIRYPKLRINTTL